MAPRGIRPISFPILPSHDAKETIEATKLYHEFVPQQDQATMPTLEAEVKLVKEFEDDEEFEHQVGGIIPDLGCTRSNKFKFFTTLELY
jgi:hypothetical protein